jgi:hypothetical protein
MKKLLGISIALALFVAPMSAVAAVKAGDSCKKVGATATTSGKKFTCIKSGKKLVWNKGVAVVKPTPTPIATISPEPTPSPKPAVTPIPTATPTPSSTPIIEKAPTGFNDLVENFKGVYVGAWNSSIAKIAANPALNVKQNILFGPNTKSPNPQIPEMFALGTRFFAGYPQPKSFDAIYFVYDDIDWASKKLLELYGNSDIAKAPSRNCQSKERCNGASANLPKKDIGQSNFGIPDVGHPDAYHLKGGIEIHEYAHMVQFMQFQDKPTYLPSGGLVLMPNWFIEGHAHVAGNVASAGSLREYKEFRSFWLNARADGLPGYSPESIESFYEKLAPGKFDPSVNSNVYSIGYFTVEALVSVKGVDSVMDLIVLVSDGATWEQAFLKVYGITWKEAAPILAKTVSRMFLERY